MTPLYLTYVYMYFFFFFQFPILNDEKENTVQLKILRQDIQTVCIVLSTLVSTGVAYELSLRQLSGLMQPTLLRGKSLSSINFWMNSAEARSSTHYDPHHNLLCVVSGCKKGKPIVFL